MNKEFEVVIKEYLDKRASEDELFAKDYAKENKSIKECCRFIMNETNDELRVKVESLVKMIKR